MSTAKTAPQYHTWWYAKTKFDKESEKWVLNKDKLEIDIIEFLDWLYLEGYRYTKIYDNGILFRVTQNRILEEIETAQVRQFVIQWIDALPPDIICNDRRGELEMEVPRKLLKETIVKGVNYFFDTKKLEACLGPKETFTMCADTRTTKYAYFLNGYLHINTKGIEFCNYNELPGYIWASEIIQHSFNMALAKDAKDEGQVKRFFQFVANGAMPPNPTDKQLQDRAIRFADLCTIAGYLCHSFNRYKLKAILLTDARMSEGNEPNGRSGKTLFMRLVGGFICADPTQPGQKTFVEIAGKNFDPSDKFRYDKAAHETKIICLNDVKRYFKTEWLFNDITDGLEVNKKNQQPFMLLVKMAVLSNLPIDLAGDSNLDRFLVFEFSEYFNRYHDPAKEFGNMFLSEQWSQKDWNQYYYFLAQCVRTFFNDGCQLPQPAQINYQRRNLVEVVGRDLLDFIENEWRPVNREFYNVKTMYNQFVQSYPDNVKLKQSKFTMCIQKYMKDSGKYEPYTEANNFQRDADGNRSICFISNKNPLD